MIDIESRVESLLKTKDLATIAQHCLDMPHPRKRPWRVLSDQMHDWVLDELFVICNSVEASDCANSIISHCLGNEVDWETIADRYLADCKQPDEDEE